MKERLAQGWRKRKPLQAEQEREESRSVACPVAPPARRRRNSKATVRPCGAARRHPSISQLSCAPVKVRLPVWSLPAVECCAPCRGTQGPALRECSDDKLHSRTQRTKAERVEPHVHVHVFSRSVWRAADLNADAQGMAAGSGLQVSRVTRALFSVFARGVTTCVVARMRGGQPTRKRRGLGAGRASEA